MSVEKLVNFDTAAGRDDLVATQQPATPAKTERQSTRAPVKGTTVVSLPIPPAKVRAVATHALRATTSDKTQRSAALRPVRHAVTMAPISNNTALVAKKPVPVRTAVVPQLEKPVKPKKKPQAVRKRAARPADVKSVRTVLRSKSPKAGIYFVIGSFRNHGNARDYRGQYVGLAPTVLAAKLDGGPIYRVVVGPIAEGRERLMHRTIYRAGISDTWAIRVDPNDWFLAGPEPLRSASRDGASEIAKLPR